MTVATEHPSERDTVRLSERLLRIRRAAVVGLHDGAGARTVVETLAADFHARGSAVGVTRLPRTNDDGDTMWPEKDVSLPAGAHVVTAAAALQICDALEAVERLDGETPLVLCRVTREGAVPVYGPSDDPTLEAALRLLEAAVDGPVLVEGSWDRCGFASPTLTKGVLLAVGAGYSDTPERSAAALRYALEIFRLGPGDVPAARLCREAAERRVALAVDRNGRVLDEFGMTARDPAARLENLGSAPGALILPGFLSDDFFSLLVRSSLRCDVVVRDPTRVRVSPVYFRAWEKQGARVCVAEPARLVAVATNPTRGDGPDVKAAEFRDLVAGSAGDVPVHDVRAELVDKNRRWSWKFWGR